MGEIAKARNTQVGILSRVNKFLDKPGSRGLLGLLATFYALVKTGKLIWIFYDLAWGHRFPDAVLFDRHVNWLLSAEKFKAETKDNWLFVYQPKAGDVVIDVGAGIGTETYTFSKAVGPTGKVISIEAHPATYICLKKLCEYNKLDNVLHLNLAIQADESTVRINDPQNHLRSSIVDIQDGIEVKGATLDTIIKKLGITEIAFLKMNIEGAERLAVKGLGCSIRKAKYVCISCHDFLADRDGNELMRTKETVLEFLEQNGFTLIPRDDPREWIRSQVNATNPNLGKPTLAGH